MRGKFQDGINTSNDSWTDQMRHGTQRAGEQREWMDLRALTQYACVSERTIRDWIHRAVDPLPASRVGIKILVRRCKFDRWLETHQVTHIDVGGIVDELVAGVKGMD